MSGPALLPVKLQPSNVRPIAYRVLSKKHGLNIQSDALAALSDEFSTRFGAQWRGPKGLLFLEDIARTWKLQDRGLFVDGPGLVQVIKEITKEQSSRSNSTVARSSRSDLSLLAARTDTLVYDGSSGVQHDVMDWRDFVKFVMPNEQPNFVFDRTRKQFHARDLASKKLSHALKDTLEYFQQRYFLISDRLSRDETFQKSSFSSIAAITRNQALGDTACEITLIKNVLGRDGSRFVLFGLLSRNINGDFILEDSSDFIELDILRAIKSEGLFYCLGMYVVVEGIYSASGGSMSNNANVISGRFHVSSIGQPPAEKRDVSLEAYGHLDFMGLINSPQASATSVVKIDKTLRKKFSTLEKTLNDHRVILLGSNIYLDDFKIRAGLTKFFAKLEDQILDAQENGEDGNFMLVMTGSFTSLPLTASKGLMSISNSEEYKSNFDFLAEMLAKYPLVVNNCKFLLIPGTNDPWQSSYSLGKPSSSMLPQTPIPKVFVSRLDRLLPKGNLILGWNPMRISYISQELFLFRDDLMNKLKRNDIVFEHDLEQERAQVEKEMKGEDLLVENILADEVHLAPKVKQARKLVKTLLDQGNLLPFLKDLRLVNPTFQHVMRVEPLPTTLMLFDPKFETFEVTYNGCKVANLGCLISNQNSRKLNYAEYRPSTKKYVYKELFF